MSKTMLLSALAGFTTTDATLSLRRRIGKLMNPFKSKNLAPPSSQPRDYDQIVKPRASSHDEERFIHLDHAGLPVTLHTWQQYDLDEFEVYVGQRVFHQKRGIGKVSLIREGKFVQITYERQSPGGRRVFFYPEGLEGRFKGRTMRELPPFFVGDRVNHHQRGDGTVIVADENNVEVKYDLEGPQVYHNKYVCERLRKKENKPKFFIGTLVRHRGRGAGKVIRVDESDVWVEYFNQDHDTESYSHEVAEERLTRGIRFEDLPVEAKDRMAKKRQEEERLRNERLEQQRQEQEREEKARQEAEARSEQERAQKERQEAEEQRLQEMAPGAFLCPITQLLMKDPVVNMAGNTYERAAIQEWFRRDKRTDPMTNSRLESNLLIPNHNLKSQIASWRDTAMKSSENEPRSSEGPE